MPLCRITEILRRLESVHVLQTDGYSPRLRFFALRRLALLYVVVKFGHTMGNSVNLFLFCKGIPTLCLEGQFLAVASDEVQSVFGLGDMPDDI